VQKCEAAGKNAKQTRRIGLFDVTTMFKDFAIELFPREFVMARTSAFPRVPVAKMYGRGSDAAPGRGATLIPAAKSASGCLLKALRSR
jgi:hypothetical protein